MVSLQFDDFCSYLFLLIFSSAVLRDPDKRFDYDLTGIYEIDKYTLRVRILIVNSRWQDYTCLGRCQRSIWV